VLMVICASSARSARSLVFVEDSIGAWIAELRFFRGRLDRNVVGPHGTLRAKERSISGAASWLAVALAEMFCGAALGAEGGPHSRRRWRKRESVRFVSGAETSAISTLSNFCSTLSRWRLAGGGLDLRHRHRRIMSVSSPRARHRFAMIHSSGAFEEVCGDRRCCFRPWAPSVLTSGRGARACFLRGDLRGRILCVRETSFPSIFRRIFPCAIYCVRQAVSDVVIVACRTCNLRIVHRGACELSSRSSWASIWSARGRAIAAGPDARSKHPGHLGHSPAEIVHRGCSAFLLGLSRAIAIVASPSRR